VSAAERNGTGPKATTVFCDGVLVTLGVTGIVAGFDAQDGELLWRTDAPEEPAFFSAAASPACIDGVAFTHPGNYEPLTAFRADTGETLWRTGEGGFFPAPLVAEFDGIQQVVAIDSNNVIGVDPASGNILWQYPWAGGNSGGTMPILRGDLIIVGGIEGTEAFSVARTAGEWTAEPEWQTANVFMYTSNPVVASNAVFGLSSRNSGQFFALDASTGETMWLGEPREADNTAVVKAGDILFLLNDDGELIVARTDRSGFAPIRRYTVSDSSTWAQPAIVGDRIFIKDTTTLALWTLD
jgi:outer membrane protein assembly factor BamB